MRLENYYGQGRDRKSPGELNMPKASGRGSETGSVFFYHMPRSPEPMCTTCPVQSPLGILFWVELDADRSPLSPLLPRPQLPLVQAQPAPPAVASPGAEAGSQPCRRLKTPAAALTQSSAGAANHSPVEEPNAGDGDRFSQQISPTCIQIWGLSRGNAAPARGGHLFRACSGSYFAVPCCAPRGQGKAPFDLSAAWES